MSFTNRICFPRMLAMLGLSTAALSGAFAQGTLADYQRGQSLRTKAQGLVVNEPRTPTWIGETDHFWYARAVKGGSEFVLVDAATGTKKPAFDQEKLAAAINPALGRPLHGAGAALRAAQGGRGAAAVDAAARPRRGAHVRR